MASSPKAGGRLRSAWRGCGRRPSVTRRGSRRCRPSPRSSEPPGPSAAEWGHPMETGHRLRPGTAAVAAPGLQCRARRRGRTADALARGARLLVAVRHRDPRCLRHPASPAEFRDLQRRLHEPRPRVVLQPRVRGALCRTLSRRTSLPGPCRNRCRHGTSSAARTCCCRPKRRAPSPTTATRSSFPTGSSGTGCSASRSS